MWASLLSLPFTMKQPAHFDFDPSKVVLLGEFPYLAKLVDEVNQ